MKKEGSLLCHCHYCCHNCTALAAPTEKITTIKGTVFNIPPCHEEVRYHLALTSGQITEEQFFQEIGITEKEMRA